MIIADIYFIFEISKQFWVLRVAVTKGRDIWKAPFPAHT